MAAMRFAAKAVLNAGVITAFTGCVSAGMVYAGKERSEVAKGERSLSVASARSDAGLSIAPEFDGLNCFETFISTGKHPLSSTKEVSRPKDGGLSLAPEFDGLNCFETIVSKTHD